MHTHIIDIDKKPFFQTYGYQANILSILGKHPRFSAWFYTNYMYINFWIEPIPNAQYLYFDEELITRCKLLNSKSFFLSEKQKKPMLHDVKGKINQDICCILQLNERYVPTTPSYQKCDFNHGNFIYGYSDESHCLFIMTHDQRRHYREVALSYNDFIKSLDYMETAWPVITLQRNKETYSVDWGKIASDYEKYTNPISFLRDGTSCIAGMQVSLGLMDYVKQVLSRNLPKDPRIFETLREHKQVLLKKIHYFLACGVIFENATILEDYKQLYNESNICEMLFLKYSLTDDSTDANALISHLSAIYNWEKALIPQTARGLQKYLQDIRWDKPINFNDMQIFMHCGTPEEEKALVYRKDSTFGTLTIPRGQEVQRGLDRNGCLIYAFSLPAKATGFSLYARVWGSVKAYVSVDKTTWKRIFMERIAGPTDNHLLTRQKTSEYVVVPDTIYVKFQTDKSLALTDITWCYSLE